MAPLVKNPEKIRLGIAGMVPENGHPFSWAAILNGYNRGAMATCGYPAIPAYLSRQPQEAFGIPGVSVTHVWCDRPADSLQVSAASRIPEVVERATDLIGEVDAVLIPTDVGSEHLERARPFVDAGLPVFIDKPMTDRLDHLAAMCRWVDEGAAIQSASCMRYSRRLAELRDRLPQIGAIRLIQASMCKDWARYGIHALEGIYPALASGGWESARTIALPGGAIAAHFAHASGTLATIHQAPDLFGSMGLFTALGTEGSVIAKFDDPFQSFKAQLADFVTYLRTGERPFPFEQTVELMLLVIGGLESLRRGGAAVTIKELSATLKSMKETVHVHA